MDTEPHIETETDDKQQQISYRYENAKENEFKPKQYTNSVEVSESVDIMKKINEAADNLDTIIDKNDLKIFSKYEDLNENQLKNLINEKNENLIKLNNQKEESKIKLNSLLKELNKTITDNTGILYKENADPDLIFDLEKVLENKKKELKVAKNMNHYIKTQYNTMNNKLNKNNNTEKDNGEAQINNLKNENKKLQIDIRKYKDDTVINKNEVKKITDNKVYPNMIKIKSEEIRKLSNFKYEYNNKIKMSIKSLENVIKEISYLEEISQKKNQEDKDENLNNKINFWINLLKGDLSGNQEEVVAKIEKNESEFIKEINKNELKNNNLNNRAKSSLLDENIKDDNTVKSSNLIFSEKKNKNTETDNNLKVINKGVLGKYSYLKQKPLSSINNKYKLSNINKSAEEIKSNRYKNVNNKIDINIILQKDYEETTDNDYRELIDKKSQFLETNVRLEKNIKEIEKTKKFKLLSVSNIIKENEQKLKELKEQNELLEKEILNLQNLYQLTIDKERLKQEIKEKEKKNKKIIIENSNNEKEKQVVTSNKLETSNITENIILNELKESNDYDRNKKVITESNRRIGKNKSGYVDDFVPDKIVFETREQRLKKIREKYLKEDENEEIKENKLNEDKYNENNEVDENENNNDIDNNKNDDVMNNFNDDENNIIEDNNEKKSNNEANSDKNSEEQIVDNNENINNNEKKEEDNKSKNSNKDNKDNNDNNDDELVDIELNEE